VTGGPKVSGEINKASPRQTLYSKKKLRGRKIGRGNTVHKKSKYIRGGGSTAKEAADRIIYGKTARSFVMQREEEMNAPQRGHSQGRAQKEPK